MSMDFIESNPLAACDVTTRSATGELPKLPLPYDFTFWLVIGVNLSLIWLVSRVCIARPDRFLIAGGIIVLFCAALAIQQFRGAFRYVPFAGSMTSAVLYGISGVMLVGVLGASGQLIVQDSFDSLSQGVSFAMLVVGGFGVAAARMNAVWSQRIRSAIAASPEFKRPRGYSLRELLSVVTAAALAIGVGTWLERAGTPRSGEHVEAAEVPFRLPSKASDVCYRRSLRGTTTAYEFRTDEATFRAWLDETVELCFPTLSPPAIVEIDERVVMNRYEGTTTVTDGSFYVGSTHEQGRSVLVRAAFDRADQRAFFYCTAR